MSEAHASRDTQLPATNKTIERVRRWRAANPERVRETLRKWRAANPQKVREYNRRQRAKRRSAANA